VQVHQELELTELPILAAAVVDHQTLAAAPVVQELLL
jgi:hypothetical protein